jgi:hypothetical protein
MDIEVVDEKNITASTPELDRLIIYLKIVEALTDHQNKLQLNM